MKKVTDTLNPICQTTKITRGLFPKLRLIYLYLTLSTKRWLGYKPEFKTFKKISVWKGNVSAPFFLKRQLDFDVLRDAFARDQYEISDTTGETRTIFDFGSNVGATVVKFCLSYPRAKIYAVEPDQNNYVCLVKNTEFFKDRVVAINKAVSGTNGEKVAFYSGSQYHWSSSLFDRTKKYIDNSTSVETVSIDCLFQEYNIEKVDILKCDIEGAEEKAFKNCTKLDRFHYIVGELHPTLIESSTDDFLKIFRNFDLLSLDTGSWVFKLKNRLYKI